MPLTVLSVAYPFAPVGPDAVGGAEQILSALDRGITRAGYKSVVVAHHGSQTAGTLVSTEIPSGTLTDELRSRVTAAHQQSIDRALRADAVDLVHFHGLDFHSYRLPSGIPALATLHLPPSWYPKEIWTRSAPGLQCVSQSQRDAAPASCRELPVIENGVFDEAEATHVALHAPCHFALALGRICPEKNFHVALDAGAAAGTAVLLGGQIFPYPDHELYFHDQIEPRLKWGNRFLGPLSSSRRNRLLSVAQCLLLPSLAPETSSLTAMEALSAGTPVIAFPSGALPEIVEDGVTGFLVSSQREMASAIHYAGEIDRQRCREVARERFSRSRMVGQYISLYEELARAKPKPVSYDAAS